MKSNTENFVAELREAESAASQASQKVEQLASALHMSNARGAEASERNKETRERLMEEKQARIDSATKALEKGEQELARCQERIESINAKIKKAHSDVFVALNTLLDRRGKLESEIPQLQKMIVDSREALTRLEIECDLSDKDAFSEIGRLQILSELLPRRIEGKEAALAAIDEEIHVVADLHVAQTVSKLAGSLEQSLLSKTRKDLESHFAKDQLEGAVQTSTPIREIRRISGAIKPRSQFESAVEHAQNILGAFQALTAFAKEHNLNQ